MQIITEISLNKYVTQCNTKQKFSLPPYLVISTDASLLVKKMFSVDWNVHFLPSSLYKQFWINKGSHWILHIISEETHCRSTSTDNNLISIQWHQVIIIYTNWDKYNWWLNFSFSTEKYNTNPKHLYL